jgi:hypothetical protein
MKQVFYSFLTPSQRKEKREEYVKFQKGKCLYCKESLINNPPERITSKHILWELFPNDFLKYPIHLQHNHNTDLTEGAVHAYCNAVMWQYEKR